MRKRKVVLISGTPASGKNSVTETMIDASGKFLPLRKHRSFVITPPKKGNEYIDISEEKFSKMAGDDKFLQHHSRYGKSYGVSKSELNKIWAIGKTPIIHVGSYSNIEKFLLMENVLVISVLLLTDIEETKSRLRIRHGDNEHEISQRLEVFKEERAELGRLIKKGSPIKFDLILNNTDGKSNESAAKILNYFYACN